MLALSMNAFAQIPTNGLVGYWPFNGNANDESGNGHNGTVHGATLTTDKFGNANNAYSFNGLNSYIDIPSSDLYNTDKFTVSIWANIFYSNIQTWDVFLVNKGSSPIQWRIYSQGVTIAGDTCALVNDIFTSTGRYINALPIKVGFWRNIIMSGDEQQLRTYVDGILVDSIPYNSTINKVNNNFTLGARYDGNITDFFIGELDELRLYNRVLTVSEITALFNEGLCFETITVTDTLIINVSLTGFNPVTYANTIKVYPNPTNNMITIDCGNNFSTLNGYTIKIANNLGQLVYTSLVNQQTTTIDLNSWTGKGIYFVHLIDGRNNAIDIKKIVLQ